MRVARAVEEAAELLAASGCESPRVDAEFLVGHVVGLGRSELALEPKRKLATSEEAELQRLVARRARREPLAYVLGEWGFRRLTLSVDPRVLIPRPETEVVVERCLALIAAIEEPRVLDVGTGSGAIALAIADEHRGARVTGIDASPAALEVAGANATRTGLTVALGAWDLFTGLPQGPWDLVVSNPPYVLPSEIDALEPEVRDWEPRQALVGEGATEAVARGALDVLRPGGALVLEVAGGDARRVERLLGELGYRAARVTADLAGRDRVVEAMTTSASRGSLGGERGRRAPDRHVRSPAHPGSALARLGRAQRRMSSVDETVAALAAGELAVIPTDTVYGLACRPDREDAVRALSALKRRSPDQPIALVGSSVAALRDLVPEIPHGVLTGPFTFVVANPQRRLPWLSGARPESIGVRVPDVTGVAAALLDRVGVVAATSANLHGETDPSRLADVPEEILDAVAAVLDAGVLPGAPSTVVDLTGSAPRVLREGAVPAAEALNRIGK